MSRFQLFVMNRVFAGFALVLSLGYLIPLFPLPWVISSGQAETRFLQESWILGLGLLVFNLGGSILLLQVSRRWTWYALIFSVVQVLVWWRFSGFFATDSNLVQFLSQKGSASLELLKYPDFKVRFVAFHQDVLAGAFYHLSAIWFATQLFLSARQPEKLRS